MDLIYEYQDQTKTLSEEISNDLIADIPKKFTAWNDKRQPQIDDTKAIRNAVYQKIKPKSSEQWQSSFNIPDLFEIKQTLKAHIWENIYQNPDNMFDVEGMDEQSKGNELSQKAMLVDSLKSMKIQFELDKAIDDLIDTGDACLFVGWETKTKQIRRKKTVQEKISDTLFGNITEIFKPKEKFVIEEKTVYEGAKVKRIDPMALVFDDDKTIWISRTFKSPQSLKENKVYKMPDYEELKNIAEGNNNDNLQNNKNDEITDDSIISHNGRIEILEVYGDIKLSDGTILKNWLVVIAGRKQIIRFESNPFVSFIPFVYSNLIEDPDTQRGISILKPILPMSELNSEILNKKVDALKLSINKPYLAPKGSLSGKIELKEGAVIEYDPALMPQAPIPIEVHADQGWDFIQFIKALMESTTGVFKNMSGNVEGDNTTATEIKARVGGQTSRLSMILDTLNQNLIIPTVENIADLIANFKFGTEQVKGTIKGQSQFINIDDSVRQGNYKYIYSDRSAIQDKRVRADEVAGIYREFAQLPEIQERTDPVKTMSYLFEQHGFDDMEEKIKRDVDPTAAIQQ